MIEYYYLTYDIILSHVDAVTTFFSLQYSSTSILTPEFSGEKYAKKWNEKNKSDRFLDFIKVKKMLIRIIIIVMGDNNVGWGQFNKVLYLCC